MSRNITIRAATPLDSKLIAMVVCMAVDYETSHPIYTVFEELAQHNASQYSWRNTLIAEVDGEVAGAIVGYDGAMLKQLREPIFPLLIKYLGSAKEIEDETEAGEFYLDSLGVLPHFRGLGIGAKLIVAMCDKAFSEGHQRAGLIVDIDTPRAEKLYTSLGFEYVGDKCFLGHAMHHLQLKANSE